MSLPLWCGGLQALRRSRAAAQERETRRAGAQLPVDGRRMLTKCTVTVAARQKGGR